MTRIVPTDHRLRRGLLLIAVGAFSLVQISAYALQAAAGAAGATKTPQAAAPIDITGYWVSVVSEDWRFRMVTPKRGDYSNIPLNPEGRKIADAWDPAKDAADGAECKAYGAPGVMRLPTRLHITWQDPTTLKIEADNGTQVRLIHVLGPQAVVHHAEGMKVEGFTPGGPSYQGDSLAQWEMARTKGGSLKVVTRNLKPGYLQKNGVPYSSETLLTEYFDRFDEPNGDSWLLDVVSMDDPNYLRAPFINSTHYKKEPDGTKWDPSPCSIK